MEIRYEDIRYLPGCRIGNALHDFNLSFLLHEYYVEAHKEKCMCPFPVKQAFSIYPASLYKMLENMSVDKTIDFCFIGQINANNTQYHARRWMLNFVATHFGEHSYLQLNRPREGYQSKGVFDYTTVSQGNVPRYNIVPIYPAQIDRHYYEIMKKTKFCLCPAGDEPWSMRFIEAIMCKCIPIVRYRYETWRSQEESKLDYQFYYADAPEFVYREDWVQHNYDIFLRYHTLEYV